MFGKCSSLHSIVLTNFNCVKIEEDSFMKDMSKGCNNLKKDRIEYNDNLKLENQIKLDLI